MSGSRSSGPLSGLPSTLRCVLTGVRRDGRVALRSPLVAPVPLVDQRVRESEARTLILVEQELPPSELIDRPSLAIDPERIRAFASWLEQQHDWAPHTASIDRADLSAETRDEMDRFYAAPNLWEVPERPALDLPRQLDRSEDM